MVSGSPAYCMCEACSAPITSSQWNQCGDKYRSTKCSFEYKWNRCVKLLESRRQTYVASILRAQCAQLLNAFNHSVHCEVDSERDTGPREKYYLFTSGAAICSHFCSSQIAIPMRSMRLWRDRYRFINEADEVNLGVTMSHITRVSRGGTKKDHLKTRTGREMKWKEWIYALQNELRQEFEIISSLGMKYNLTTLRHLALYILRSGGSPHSSVKMMVPGQINYCIQK